ncbi:hypothetical protein Pcac1_g21484 [Phytophthora cactorum]|nr:hypothetical protein Pcac1_g21484 [Phytophthora cactorum]
MEAADVVARLRLLQSEEHENLERSAATFGDYADYVEEEVLETESPVMDSFVLQGGNWVLKTLTNFTQAEFGVLWAEVEGALHAVWSMPENVHDATRSMSPTPFQPSAVHEDDETQMSLEF